MIDDVHKALGLWGLEGADFAFVAGRENRIYKVTYNGNSFALRFKRPGYRDRAELQSELDWLAEMARAGLSVPQPLPSLTGQLIEQVDGQYIDLITWMSGTPLGMSRQPLQLLDPIDTFFRLGAEMASCIPPAMRGSHPLGLPVVFGMQMVFWAKGPFGGGFGKTRR